MLMYKHKIIKICAMISLRERVGVRGKSIPGVLAASALDSTPENRPKGHMALSHS